jgi:hypothetical protein
VWRGDGVYAGVGTARVVVGVEDGVGAAVGAGVGAGLVLQLVLMSEFVWGVQV